MAAKFEIRSPKAGQFRWVLVSQGRTLATGETYSRRALAQKSIDSFRMAATAAPVDDLTQATAAGKVARVAGRVAAKAVVKGVRAVEKVTAKAAKSAPPARTAKKSPASR